MRITATAVFTAVLLAGATTPALATVTFDPGTGTGFVGKGDVQLAWGWNNAKLQSAASGVTFSYVREDAADFEVTCEWDTVNKKQTIHHAVTNTRSVNSSVAYDVTTATRKNPQGSVTGFRLNGFGPGSETTSGQAIPAVGDGCPNGGDGIVTSVAVISATSSSTLYVSNTGAGMAPTAIWSASQ